MVWAVSKRYEYRINEGTQISVCPRVFIGIVMAEPTTRIENQTRGTLIADKAEVARSFMARGRGLMGRTSLPEGYALVIYPEWSIHMFFMRIPIDVLFVGMDHRVVGLRVALPPWRPYAGEAPWRCRYVIELPANILPNTRTAVGDQLLLTPALD